MPAILPFLLANWRTVAVVAGVLALLGGAWGYVEKVKHDAYVSGFNTAHQQCEDDKAKQETANQNAANEAAKKLDDLEKKLNLKDIQLDDYLKGIDLAADAAPDAGTCGLDVDSVRRLNAIG